MTTLDDLIERVEKATGPDACWPWPRKLDARGRGRIWVDGRITLAHRAVWEHRRGPIPAGKILCHTCDNPTCVNPAHLYVGTHADNMRDMTERKRYFAARSPERVREIGRQSGLKNDWSKGERNPKSKLTAEQVLAIRADTRPTRFLVAEYGVNRTSIQNIRRGVTWSALALVSAALRARRG